MPNLSDFINWCIEKCNASDVGYSQNYRNQQTVNGITYYDCSSFVNYALLAGGWSTPAYAPDNNPFTTHNMVAVLLSLGWEEVSITGEWKQGDILWRSLHTEVVYSGGTGKGCTMGAHGRYYTVNGVQKLRPLATQVSINSYESSSSSWTKMFRYTGSGTVPTKPDEKVSMYVIAAMCGNFMKESQVNPGVWQDLKKGTATSLLKGLGLGQWTNTDGDTHGRLYQMYQYCSQHGGIYNGDAQCDYVVQENVWLVRDSSYGISTLTEFLNSTSTDVESLALAWARNWEGVPATSTDDLSARVAFAKLILNYLTDHASDQVDSWTSVNDWITQEKQLQNCVLVYQHFNSDSSAVNPDPVAPVDDGNHRVVLIANGDGYVQYDTHIAKQGTEISGGAYANNTDTSFERWVIRYPYDLAFNHTDDQYNSIFNFTMPDSTVVGRAYFTGSGYSDQTKLTLIVSGYCDLTITWYTQDGGSQTETISFDSLEQEVYTYNIGITDDVHIYVSDGCTITPLTKYVAGWTYDESTKMYFFFQPDTDVTLNVVGSDVPISRQKQKHKWWMYLRPTWTWKYL